MKIYSENALVNGINYIIQCRQSFPKSATKGTHSNVSKSERDIFRSSPQFFQGKIVIQFEGLNANVVVLLL